MKTREYYLRSYNNQHCIFELKENEREMVFSSGSLSSAQDKLKQLEASL